MAYVDILAQSSYMSVSKKAAKVFGLEVAAYLSELANVAVQVRKKKSYDDDGYFTLDRKYIEEETTLPLAKQIECDAVLKMSAIVGYKDPEDASVIGVDLQALAAVLAEDDLTKIAVVNRLPKEMKEESKRIAKKMASQMSKQSAEEKKAAREAAIRDTMKRICSEMTQDASVQDSLSKWVDSIYDSHQFLNRNKIEAFMSQISSFSPDPQVQNRLISIAMMKSWVIADWAINTYSRDVRSRPASSPSSLGTQKIATAATVSKEAF